MASTDDYSNRLERFNDNVQSRSTFIRVGMVALFVTYFATLELTSLQTKEAWLDIVQQSAIDQKLQRLTSRARTEYQSIFVTTHGATAMAVPNGQSDTSPEQRKEQRAADRAKKRLQALSKREAAFASEKSDLRKRLSEDADVSLPGLSLKMPFSLVAASWLAGAGFLFLFAARARRSSASELTGLESNPKEYPQKFAFDPPTWLQPFPWEARPGECALPGDGRRDIIRSLPLTFASAVAIAITLRVVYLGLENEFILAITSPDRRPAIEIAEPHIGDLFTDFALFLAIAIAAFGVAFFILDSLAKSSALRMSVATDASRRTFVYGGASLLALTAVPVAIWRLSQFQSYQKRLRELFVDAATRRVVRGRRRRPLETSLKTGFYVNPKTKRIHYVNSQHRIFGLDSAARVDRFVYKPDAPHAQVKYTKARLPNAFEEHALSRFRRDPQGLVDPTPDECARAIRTLLDGAKIISTKRSKKPVHAFAVPVKIPYAIPKISGSRPPEIFAPVQFDPRLVAKTERLYILAAKLALRYDQKESMQQLLAQLDLPELPRGLEKLRAELTAWHSEADPAQPAERKYAAWIKRWSDHSRTVRWGVPQPPAEYGVRTEETGGAVLWYYFR